MDCVCRPSYVCYCAGLFTLLQYVCPNNCRMRSKCWSSKPIIETHYVVIRFIVSNCKDKLRTYMLNHLYCTVYNFLSSYFGRVDFGDSVEPAILGL